MNIYLLSIIIFCRKYFKLLNFKSSFNHFNLIAFIS